jgi:hypothetical protein
MPKKVPTEAERQRDEDLRKAFDALHEDSNPLEALAEWDPDDDSAEPTPAAGSTAAEKPPGRELGSVPRKEDSANTELEHVGEIEEGENA